MRRLLILLLSLVLCACGFELRGTAQLPEYMSQTYVQISPTQRELRDEIHRLLRANDITVVTVAEDAGAILDLSTARLDREIQSVGETARVREFALVYRVSPMLRTPAETTWQRNLELRRDYTFDQQQLVGLAQEEEVLRRDMAREMASLILAELSAAQLQ